MELDSTKKSRRDKMMRSNSFETQEERDRSKPVVVPLHIVSREGVANSSLQ